MVYNILMLIPKLIEGITALIKFARNVQYNNKVEENKKTETKIEEAKTTQEKQDALNQAHSDFNKH